MSVIEFGPESLARHPNVAPFPDQARAGWLADPNNYRLVESLTAAFNTACEAHVDASAPGQIGTTHQGQIVVRGFVGDGFSMLTVARVSTLYAPAEAPDDAVTTGERRTAALRDRWLAQIVDLREVIDGDTPNPRILEPAVEAGEGGATALLFQRPNRADYHTLVVPADSGLSNPASPVTYAGERVRSLPEARLGQARMEVVQAQVRELQDVAAQLGAHRVSLLAGNTVHQERTLTELEQEIQALLAASQHKDCRTVPMRQRLFDALSREEDIEVYGLAERLATEAANDVLAAALSREDPDDAVSIRPYNPVLEVAFQAAVRGAFIDRMAGHPTFNKAEPDEQWRLILTTANQINSGYVQN